MGGAGAGSSDGGHLQQVPLDPRVRGGAQDRERYYRHDCVVEPRLPPDIIETELLGQKSLLREGLLSYRPNTAQTLRQFQAGKEVGESWKEFVIKLAALVRIDEVQAWELLCNYLSTEYRGTSDSLAQLLKVGLAL